MFDNWKRSRVAVGMIAATALATVLAGCGTQNSAAIVATYNGGTVTASQLDEQVHLEQLFNPKLTVNKTVKQQVAQTYILYFRVLVQKEKQAGIKVPTTLVDQQVLQAKQQIIQQSYGGSQATFDAKMQSLNLTDANLASYIQTGLMFEQYAKSLVKSVPITQQQQYYQKNLDQYATVTVRHILVKSLPLAQKIYTELRNGGSWKTLAKEYSVDTGSKNTGGQYPPTTPSSWVPSFAAHAMTQPVDVVGQPFKSRYGYHVMEVLHRVVEPFKTVQSSIQQQLVLQQEQQIVPAVVGQLQKAANIKVTL